MAEFFSASIAALRSIGSLFWLCLRPHREKMDLVPTCHRFNALTFCVLPEPTTPHVIHFPSPTCPGTEIPIRTDPPTYRGPLCPRR